MNSRNRFISIDIIDSLDFRSVENITVARYLVITQMLVECRKGRINELFKLGQKL